MKLPHKKIRAVIKVTSIILFLWSVSKTVRQVMKNGGTDSDGTTDEVKPETPDYNNDDDSLTSK